VLPERTTRVVDAGFDAYWSELGVPGKGHLTFVVPSRLGYLDMRIQSAQSASIDGEPALQVRLVVDTWLGFLAPTIDVTYAMSDHAVRRFEGIANILDASGKRQEVRIEFPVSAILPAPTSRDIERAAALPLSSQCAA
jgi:hypothetical protein